MSKAQIVGWAHSNFGKVEAPDTETLMAGVVGAKLAWQKALEQSGLTLDDLSLVESHDCLTIAELIANYVSIMEQVK